MKQHALLVSDVAFPRVNGVSTSIRTFRADLSAIGVETTLVAPDYGRGLDDEAGRADGIRIASRPIPFDPEDRLMQWRALRDALLRQPPRPWDVVHVQTPFVAHYAGVRAARRFGIPVVATCHTWFEDYLHHYLPMLPHAAGRMLARRLTRSQFAQVDAVIAPTPQVRDRLRDYGFAAPIHVIPTGLPAERFAPGDGAAFRRAWGIAPDRPLVLALGRVAFEKNLSFLLRSFAHLRRVLPGALLLVAGEGPARAAIEREGLALGLGDGLRLIGNLDRAQTLSDCYAAADVFVFASRTETQGLTLLEAMAQGTPVVSTACLGTRAVLGEGCGARVVEEDEAAFSSATLEVLLSPDLAARMASRQRAWAQRWSSRGMAWRLAELYAELAVERPRRDVNGAAQRCAELR